MLVKEVSLLNPSLQRLRCSHREIFGDTQSTRSYTCGLAALTSEIDAMQKREHSHMLMNSDGESYDAAGMTLAIAPACTYKSQKNKAHFTCTSVHLMLANHHSKKEEPEWERERGGESGLCSFILSRSSSHILNISLFLSLVVFRIKY